MDFYKDKVAVGFVYLVGVHRADSLAYTLSFAGNELACFPDIFFVGEHDLAGDGSQGVDGPWVFLLVDFLQQVLVAADGVAKAETRCSEKFGNTPEDNNVIVIFCQRNGGDSLYIRCKFHIGFIHQYRNGFFLAVIQNIPHLVSRDHRRSRVVRVAEDQKVHIVGKFLGQSRYIQPERGVLCQAEIMAPSAVHGDLTLVFRISRSYNEGLGRMGDLDKQRDQLCGAVSHYDVFKIRTGVLCDALTQRSVLPVRIRSNSVNVVCQSFPQPERNT